MKCSDVRPLLDLLSDGALAAKDCALVLGHLASCKECQAECSDLEHLHSRFQDAKEKSQMSPDLLERISKRLKSEDVSERKRIFKRYVKAAPLLAVAAVLLAGFLVIPWLYQTATGPPNTYTTSAEALVEDLAGDSTLDEVKDRSELAKRLGYELKFLRLPAWQMEKSGICKLPAPKAIARFDFVRKGDSGNERFSCYQATQGMIRVNCAEAKIVAGKNVFFGSNGKFQFALWTQEGRDYLLVTRLSEPLLEEIVRGA